MKNVSVNADAALEALVGQVADEFLQRQARGEHPDIEEYTARHPEAADVLRRVLTSLHLFDAAPTGAGEPGALASGEGPTGTLGDFRILREVGRGGMGVVYEAEQISLGRRVALKVLPFAATMDPRHLQRFQNEARAAASLHHTNIVPVHAVGQERGIHFYAMQFIDGQGLAAFLEEQRGESPERNPVSSEKPGFWHRNHQGGSPGTDQPTTAYAPSLSPAAPVAETAVQAASATARSPRDTAYFRRVAE